MWFWKLGSKEVERETYNGIRVAVMGICASNRRYRPSAVVQLADFRSTVIVIVIDMNMV